MSPSPEAVPPRRPARRLLRIMWALLLLQLVVLAAWLYSRSQAASELPLIKPVPAFDLLNRDERTVSSSDLLGKPWIADFIFTRCPGVCPIMSQRMQDLASDLPADGVNLVSISVDPEYDTPEVLEHYAQRHEAADNWLFLTGATEVIHPLIREGFLLALDPSPGDFPDAEPILHSNRFVLVDADGLIRGYYDSFSAEDLARLRVDARRLIKD